MKLYKLTNHRTHYIHTLEMTPHQLVCNCTGNRFILPSGSSAKQANHISGLSKQCQTHRLSLPPSPQGSSLPRASVRPQTNHNSGLSKQYRHKSKPSLPPSLPPSQQDRLSPARPITTQAYPNSAANWTIPRLDLWLNTARVQITREITQSK